MNALVLQLPLSFPFEKAARVEEAMWVWLMFINLLLQPFIIINHHQIKYLTDNLYKCVQRNNVEEQN